MPQLLRQPLDFATGSSSVNVGPVPFSEPSPAGQRFDIGQMTRQVILDRYCPTALLIDRKGTIIYVQGRTGKYLETPTGVPTNNILDMAREGLRVELSAALRLAKSSGQPVVRDNIGVSEENSIVRRINLHVNPLQAPKELAGRYLVVFEEARPSVVFTGEGEPLNLQGQTDRLYLLEKELKDTRESHQIVVEELESSNEELKSTNEELQSANEELQSTNEELESSREELHSLNEELQTVNAELRNKVDDLCVAQDDMRNLLNGTEIATIFVDNDRCIRRFTNEATTIIDLLEADIGRPLELFVSNLSYDGMIADLGEVLRTLAPREHEVQTKDGRWYKMRILPYRTADHRIDGAVLTFASIDQQKQAQQVLRVANMQMEQAGQLVSKVFDLTPDPLAVLDSAGRIVIANVAFARVMGIAAAEVHGVEASKIMQTLGKDSALPGRLQGALGKGENFRLGRAELPQLTELGASCLDGQILDAGESLPYRILLRFMMEL